MNICNFLIIIIILMLGLHILKIINLKKTHTQEEHFLTYKKCHKYKNTSIFQNLLNLF